MALSKDEARGAVAVGALATGSLAFAFPRLSARLMGSGGGDGEATFVRMLGARSISYGALLMILDDDDAVQITLMAGAASASADTIAALSGAARHRRGWPGALLAAAVSGTMAGLASWALVTPQ